MILISLIYNEMYEQQGYVLMCTQDITKHNIVNLCKMITMKYNDYFDNHYYFEPEAVSEEFINYLTLLFYYEGEDEEFGIEEDEGDERYYKFEDLKYIQSLIHS